MTVAELIEQYDAARIAALVAASQWPRRDGHCQYCGKRWWPFAGTKLDGHAKCVVGEPFKALLVALMADDPTWTQPMVADALGVTVAVLRAWVSPTTKARGST